MKILGWRKCRKTFLEATFSHSRKLFSKFGHNIFVIILRNIIGFENFLLSFSQSKSRITMCDLHWCCTFCTDVTLFALVLHLNCTALSQSESSNFFMYFFSCVFSCIFSQGFGPEAKTRGGIIGVPA